MGTAQAAPERWKNKHDNSAQSAILRGFHAELARSPAP
jgi:hypothetical protein